MEKLKQNRAASFIFVAVVYIVAAAIGVAVYGLVEAPWWLALLAADVAATVITFVFSVVFKNASVYDPYWSVQPIFILLAYAARRPVGALGVLVIVTVCLWGLRLTANWAYTFKGLMHQDWRYTMLREKTGIFYPVINFVGIHMVPTLVVYGCTVPAVQVILQGAPLCAGSVACLFVSLFAACLQAVADVQMHAFRKSGRGGFIRVGLWKYSRHPNYLGELLMWWGIAGAAICAMPQSWHLAAGAVANTVLFFAVSIPMADGRQAKKEGFAEYKAATRMLLPIKK